MSRRILMLAGLAALIACASPQPALAMSSEGGPVPALLAVQQQATPAGGDFVPVSELPATKQGEQLPAAPMLIAAYAVVWVALILYVWSLWRRLAAVEREVADVARRVEDSRRA